MLWRPLLASGVLTGAAIAAACGAGEPAETRAAVTGPRRDVIVPPSGTLSPVFSPAIRTGDLIFLSGAIGVVPGTTELVEGGIRAETRQALENLGETMRAAGGSLRDAVKCTVFLADIEDYAAMNEVYGEFFPEDPPARSTLAASGLALGARTEIECIAVAPE